MALVEGRVIQLSEIETVKIESADEAEAKRFLGSPTILVNGKDIYTEKAPQNFAYTCRVYIIDGVQTGVLPKEYLYKKIEKLK